MRPEDRERIQVEVTHRVVEHHVRQARRAPEGYLPTVVNDTVYHERRRLDKADPRKARTRAERAFYQRVGRQLRHASDAELRELLRELAERFVAEVVGNFDERVYRLSTNVLPVGLTLLLRALSAKRLLDLGALRAGLRHNIRVEGAVDHVRSLAGQGALVVVPTHSSNLDSIILGYAAHLIGLPPLIYGAGLNLFSNPLISFFMNNLGAYRVDRRKTAGFYKEILKEYATAATEFGYHQLFFPGGTRSRSGAVERHLKKGLLGTPVKAYVNALRANRPRPRVFVVPCTLSYRLVLEAETLIEDHLQETGKARYIIEDDEFSKPRRVLNFFTSAMGLDDEIVVTLSEPLDIVGNRVDAEGQSLDPRGRVVDTLSYVTRDGEVVHDDQRDTEYTNELAEAVLGAYRRDSMLMSTNVVARALFHLLERANPQMDLYRLLQTGGEAASFPMLEVHVETERILGALGRLTDGPRLSPELRSGDVQAIVADALAHFGTYHTHAAAERRGDHVFHGSRTLLLYYGNRLSGYDLASR